MIGSKVCTGCGIEKPLSQFHRRAASPDGLNYRCRDCVLQYAALRREPIREALAKAERARRAADPASYREYSRLANQRWRKSNPDRKAEQARRWSAANRTAIAEKNRRYLAMHPEARRATNRRWYLDNKTSYRINEHRRRSRLAEQATVPFTVEQLEGRFSMFAGCWICGGPKETIDHVKPLAKGGPHLLANLRPACFACNRRKNAKWPYEASA